MTTWLTRCFAGLLLVLPFVPAVADDPDDLAVIEDRLYGPELRRLARDTKWASQQLGLALRELLQDRQAPG